MLLFLLPGKSNAYVLQPYTTKDGLISNTVYRAFRDSKGYMWFCTDKGLSRFDGHHFRNFTVADGMSDNEVFNIYEDRLGRLWLFTFNGQPSCYFNGRFYNRNTSRLLRRLPVLPFINTMYETRDALYIAYVNGELLRVGNDTLNWIRKQNGISNKLMALQERKGYILGVAQDAYLYIREGKLERAVKRFTEYCCMQEGILLMLDRGGVREEGPGGRYWQYKDTTLIHNTVLTLYNDSAAGRLLVSSRSGLMIINKRNGHKEELLPHMAVSGVAQDNYHNYWITTLEHGIYCLDAGLFNAASVDSSGAYQVLEHTGALLLQDGRQLLQLQKKGERFIMVPAFSLPHTTDLPLYMDENRLLYRNLHGADLFIHERKTGKNSALHFGIGHRQVWPWHKDTFLLVDYQGIYKLYLGPEGPKAWAGMTGNERIQKRHLSPGGQVLYTAGRKLYRYDPVRNQVTVMDSFDYNTTIESIFTVHSWTVLCDSKKQLHLYSGPDHKKYLIKGNYIIYNVQPLGAEHYLMQTQEGYVLAAINPWPPFTVSCNAIEYPFLYLNLQSVAVHGDYLVGKAGDQLVCLKKDILNKELYVPRLFVEDIDVNGKKYAGDTICLVNTMSANISIRLNAVIASRDISYLYRIEARDQWSKWYSSESADLNLLLSKAGHYRIMIKALSKAGQASAPVFIQLDIRPPFLHSLSFYVLLVLLSLGVIAWIFQWYLRKKKRLFHDELNHLQLEHRAINALLNPHFIFNVVNNIQDLINHNSKESANNYLATMSRMIRQNIENLQFNLIPVANELALIRNYIELQNLRFNDRIKLSIEHDISNESDVFLPPLLLHTFVENAIVHGFAKDQQECAIRILIHLTINDYLYIRIIDNGRGLSSEHHRETEEGKTSLGIDFNRKRLQRISEFYKVGFRMDIQGREDGLQGTEVSVILYARFEQLIKKTER